jgi:Leucine-rich repeat (LRR) protein
MNIEKLNNLPNTLQYLDCGYNGIKELTNIPPALKYLKMPYNNLAKLGPLPTTLNRTFINIFINDAWLNGLTCPNHIMSSIQNLSFTIENYSDHIIEYNDITMTPELINYINCLPESSKLLFFNEH